jgi:putative transposase
MTTKKRRRYKTEFKFKVALEAAREIKTISQLASEYELHPNQISTWKKQLLTGGAEIFKTNKQRQQQDQAAREAELFEQIGRLKNGIGVAEKKKLSPSIELKGQLIEPAHPTLSIRRQCELLGLNRASYYYQPAQSSPLNLTLMRLIDKQYLRTPFYGYRRMTEYLRQKKHYQVNAKRVRRLTLDATDGAAGC